jgi:peptidoglycan/xylan/chitin deacetylase (PgdA/CDA1 family)
MNASTEGVPESTPIVAAGGASIASTESGGAAGAGEVAPTPRELSGLPVPATSGVPQPAGTPGNLRVLDWAGFGAAISYTFDDGTPSQIAHYPELQSLGVPLSFYLITGRANEIVSPVWPQAVLDGHEVANHTRSHLNTGSPNLAGDTDDGAADLESRFGVTVYTMAAPFGAADYIDIARSRYLINRGVGFAQIAPNGSSDPFNLPCFIPATGAPASAFNERLDGLRATRTWTTVLVHGFSDIPDGSYQPVDIQQFIAAVNYAKSFSDVWIDTVLEVGAYWIAQKVLSEVAPVSEGTSSTFSWTLPEHFPPGRFLRVTVDGGTLTQDGAPLVWDDHGYYEVALDKGSVTLSP